MTRIFGNLAEAIGEGVAFALAGLAANDAEPEMQREEFAAELEAWEKAGSESEDRGTAMQRLLACWDEEGARLDLSRLGLSSLPPCLGELYHVFQLDLSHNRLSAAPDFLQRLDAECLVLIGANPVSAEAVSAFQQVAQQDGGPRLVFGHIDASGELWELPHLNQYSGLGRALEAWREDLPSALTLSHDWHVAEEASALAFGGWLLRLRDTVEFSKASSRSVMIERVADLLSAMNEDAVLRQTCFQLAHDTTESCDDNLSLALNRYDMALRNREAERGELDEAALFELGRGMFRLDRLEAVVLKKLEVLERRQVRHDPVEVHLAYQIGLREPLALPTRASVMRFEQLAAVSPLDLKLAELEVKKSEGGLVGVALRRHERIIRQLEGAGDFAPLGPLSLHALAAFLAKHYLPWQQHLSRSYPEEMAANSQRMFDYLDRVEAEREAGRLSEGAYLSCLDAAKFYANHGVAYGRALTALEASRG